MSDDILRVLIIAVALAIVVVVALVLKRRLSIKVGDKELGTSEGERAFDQRATVKGPGSRIDNAGQVATSSATGSQNMDARAGGQMKGVRQTIRDPGDRQ